MLPTVTKAAATTDLPTPKELAEKQVAARRKAAWARPLLGAMLRGQSKRKARR